MNAGAFLIKPYDGASHFTPFVDKVNPVTNIKLEAVWKIRIFQTAS